MDSDKELVLEVILGSGRAGYWRVKGRGTWQGPGSVFCRPSPEVAMVTMLMAEDTEHFGGSPLRRLWGGPPQGAVDLSACLGLRD